MANLNKVMLIGRVTNPPKSFTGQSGGRVTQVAFVVNNRKLNSQTQQWEDEPVWIDLKFFNRGENGKLAELAAGFQKGLQIFVEGRLILEKWKDQSGQERTKLVVYADNFQYLEPRRDGESSDEGANMGGGRPAQRGPTPNRAPAPAPARTGAGNGSNGGNAGGNTYANEEPTDSSNGNEDDIPF